MDSRTVWFVAETKEKQLELAVKYPGRILLCDRTFILDTYKYDQGAIKNTTQIHELRSVAQQCQQSILVFGPCKFRTSRAIASIVSRVGQTAVVFIQAGVEHVQKI